MKTFYFSIILFLLLSACTENKSRKATKHITKTTTNTPSKKLYKSYKPANMKLDEVLFIAIDAHADADLAIEHFRWAAEQYGFQVIALNNVENNDPKFEQHILQGIAQAKQDLQINPKYIFLSGFSGGARMALNYAFSHKAQGVIMMGAGPGSQTNSFPFPLAMISGMQDFNFVEQYYPINSPQVQNPDIITLHWQGKHAWPDSSTIADAVSFILYTSTAISEENIIRIPQLEKAKQAQKNNNLFFYFKELELISKTSTGELQEKTKNSIASIQQSPKAQHYFTQFNNSLVTEQTRNQNYIKDLDEKPLDWWKTNIAKLDDLIAADNGINANSYARTRAFLGILLYSKTNAAISGQGNAKLLLKYFEIYELLEPENPDLFFFKAKYAYVISDNDGTISNLKKALKFGYNDNLKLQQNFPQVIISAAEKP